MNFVFDLYGTLVDIWTDEGRDSLWEGVAEFLGQPTTDAHEVKEEYLALCKRAKQGEFHELDLLEIFAAMLSARNMDESLAQSLATEFRRLSMVRLRAFHGVKSMLKELRKNAGVYLLSNAQACFTVDELKQCGLYHLFDGIIISSDVGVKKPSVEVFKIAFDRFGISPTDSFYVGNDMRDDILGAHGAGMGTVYIHTRQSGSYDIEIPEPDYRAKNHLDLKRLLLSLSLGGK